MHLKFYLDEFVTEGAGIPPFYPPPGQLCDLMELPPSLLDDLSINLHLVVFQRFFFLYSPYLEKISNLTDIFWVK